MCNTLYLTNEDYPCLQNCDEKGNQEGSKYMKAGVPSQYWLVVS